MTTASTLTVVNAIAAETTHIALAPHNDDAVRAQAALVRSLVDEVAHYHPAADRVVHLHEQLADELSRLAAMVLPPELKDRAPAPVDVLIVEDDDATRQATARVVTELGYHCRVVTSASDALSEYERKRPSILISDWHMPGMTGVELCRTIKRRDPHAYCILVTAYPDAPNAIGNGDYGVDDFLTKPIDIEQLTVRLEAAKRLVRVVGLLENIEAHLFKRTRSIGRA